MNVNNKLVGILAEATKKAAVSSIIESPGSVKGEAWIKITIKECGPFVILCKLLGLDVNIVSKKGGVLHMFVSHNPTLKQNMAYANAFVDILKKNGLEATAQPHDSDKVPKKLIKKLRKREAERNLEDNEDNEKPRSNKIRKNEKEEDSEYDDLEDESDDDMYEDGNETDWIDEEVSKRRKKKIEEDDEDEDGDYDEDEEEDDEDEDEDEDDD